MRVCVCKREKENRVCVRRSALDANVVRAEIGLRVCSYIDVPFFVWKEWEKVVGQSQTS